jgi:hypothetical protein
VENYKFNTSILSFSVAKQLKTNGIWEKEELCGVFLHEQILGGCKKIGLKTTRKGGGCSL